MTPPKLSRIVDDPEALAAIETLAAKGYSSDDVHRVLKALQKLHTPEHPPKQVMPRVNGKRFVCSCGCNVFSQVAPDRLRCNGCEGLYVTEAA